MQTAQLHDERFWPGEDERLQAEAVGEALRSAGGTVATAESCTGGLVSGLLTEVPGSSDYFWGGVVSYANQVKQEVLGVSAQTLATHGAVSSACVIEMARGVRQLLGTSYGVAVSGIAGPGGGTPEKPVGTVHFAAASASRCVTSHILEPGDRRAIRRAAVKEALRLLQQILDEDQRLEAGP